MRSIAVNRKSLMAVGAMFFGGVVLSPIVAVAADLEKLATDDQKYSYYMGLEFGAALSGVAFDVDAKVVSQAIRDVLEGKQLLMSREEAVKVRANLAKKLQDDRAAKVAAEASKNAEEGKEFLKNNLKNKGVKATSSGLQYKVITSGKGRRPSAMDKVTVHYRGTLINGKEFDSSHKRNKPLTLPLSGVISGWTEGVQLMNVGSKYQFFIPANLAYGKKGAGGLIGPDSTLIFEIELLEIK